MSAASSQHAFEECPTDGRKTLVIENWQGLTNQLAGLAHAFLLARGTQHEVVLPSAFSRTKCLNYYKEMFFPFALGDLIDLDALHAFTNREGIRVLPGRPNNWLIPWTYRPLQQNTTTKSSLLQLVQSCQERVVYLGNTLQCCGPLVGSDARFMSTFFTDAIRPAPRLCTFIDLIQLRLRNQQAGQEQEQEQGHKTPPKYYAWHLRMEADYYVLRRQGDIERVIAEIQNDIGTKEAVSLYICTGLVGDDLAAFLLMCRRNLSPNITVCTKTTLLEGADAEAFSLATLNCEQSALVDWWVARGSARFYGCSKSSFSNTLGLVMMSDPSRARFVDNNYGHCPTTDWSTFGFEVK